MPVDSANLFTPKPAASFFDGWLGPLGRYRPGLLRIDLARGFANCERFYLPQWLRLPLFISPEERLLLELDLTGKVVYDIGAHAGAYALFLSRQVGRGGFVVAFEPQPRSFAKLAKNLKLNRIVNVRAECVALGAAAERRDLFMLPGMRTTASLAVEAKTPLRRRAGECRVERLDDLVRSAPLLPPDFLKIDVEGMELDVLQGAAVTLERFRPRLLIEIHGIHAAAKAERVRAIAALLEPWGYAIRHVESGRAVHSRQPACAGGHLFAQCPA